MKCYTPEQLAGVALDLETDPSLLAHVHHCDACAAKLAQLTQLSEHLLRVHAQLDRGHDSSRAKLMARLATTEPSACMSPSSSRTAPVRWQPSLWQRVAVGGLGLSAIAAVVLVMLSIGATEEASAMQRMIAKLRKVTSFEYTIHSRNTSTREGVDEPVSVDYVGTVRWKSSHAIGEDGVHSQSEEGLIYEFPAGSRPGERKYRLLSRFQVMLPPGKQGIVIDHLRECFLWVPEFRGDFGEQSPVTRLRMVKDREGEMIRDLGTKNVHGREAHGFVMRLEGVEEGSGYDALNVWIDSETDLPLEIGYKVKADWGTKSLRIYDCRWNLQLSPHLFEANAPEGYTDSTPPKDRAAIDQMIAALTLYSDLSGGHYPRVEHFYGDQIHQEMLEMAGFSGDPQEGWAEDKTYQRLQQITAGLDWLTRILLSSPHARYYGRTVDSNNKDKVLFWCTTPGPGQSFRIIYGNLETEVVEGDWHKRLDEGQSPRDALLPADGEKNR